MMLDEPSATAMAARLANEPAGSRIMSVVNYVEAGTVLAGRNREPEQGIADLDAFLRDFGIALVAVDEDVSRLALKARIRSGKGFGAAAGLNFGDCFAYAGVSGVWELGLTGILLVFAPVTVVGGQFLKYFGFTVAQSPDGLRLRFGLTSHRSQTVPPGRVQAVRIERPLMWKPWGWVRVVVNVAGATGGEEGEDRPSVILPVAPLPVARAVLQQVLPGIDPFSVELTSAPTSARWRAPLQYKQLGVGATSAVFVTRRGWLVPKWDVVPHARTQSVRLQQGPWQRRLGLASVFVDSTPGPVSINALHQDAAAARVLAQEQADRAGLARRQAGPGQPESHPVAPPIARYPGNGSSGDFAP